MRFLLPVLLLLIVSLPSCVKDVSDTPATIEGRWELQKAMRNNMETEMLEGLYYEFSPKGGLNTNLMGNESPGSYIEEEGTIITQGVIPPLTYDVLELTDSTLHLRTELQGFRFDFELVR
ncbi:hypothetical protein [Lewinella sp. 4G2]|uniref:hypothetical protein n=1 Tax=Lewinella sp. 4G2 TaxID=1803372 RepID=UPI0007B4E768|nr:hypothetical protein [Lewinella sp. 4G2]OAV45599.1 hypothetical protein A3850_014350 [Lewinella sp. 4G2]